MKLDLTRCKVRWDRENYIPKKIYEAEKNLYGGKRSKGLARIFRERGILL